MVTQIFRVILLLVVLQSKYMAWNTNSTCTNILKKTSWEQPISVAMIWKFITQSVSAPIIMYSQQVCNMGPYCTLVIALHLRTLFFFIVHVNFLTTIKECYCVAAPSGRVQLKCVNARRWKWSLSFRVDFRGRNWNVNSELSSTGTGLMFEKSIAKSVVLLLLQKATVACQLQPSWRAYWVFSGKLSLFILSKMMPWIHNYQILVGQYAPNGNS